MGDIEFIIDTLENDRIRNLYQKRWYPEALYLLGMIDLEQPNNEKAINLDQIKRAAGELYDG